MAVCSAFVYLYSIDFGKAKTSKWATSMIVAFLSSVFITQPMKVGSHILIVISSRHSQQRDQGPSSETVAKNIQYLLFVIKSSLSKCGTFYIYHVNVYVLCTYICYPTQMYFTQI